MEITARQLKAIEDAIGRDAEARVIIKNDFQRYLSEAILDVRAIHKGEKLYANISVPAYRDVPVGYLAEQLVHGINREIMNKEFREVFRR